MDFDDYQNRALRTANHSLDREQLMTNAALGLCGESGEFADALKKHLFQGHDLDRDKAIKELGDILWYVSLACYALGVKLSIAAHLNNKKLATRYPQGFDPQASINRTEMVTKNNEPKGAVDILLSALNSHDDTPCGHLAEFYTPAYNADGDKFVSCEICNALRNFTDFQDKANA